VANEVDQRVANLWLPEQVYLRKKCYRDIEGVGVKDQVSPYLEMSLTGM